MPMIDPELNGADLYLLMQQQQEKLLTNQRIIDAKVSAIGATLDKMLTAFNANEVTDVAAGDFYAEQVKNIATTIGTFHTSL